MNHWLAISLGCLLIVSAVSACAGFEAAQSDDWRRTNRGWERTADWRLEQREPAPPARAIAIHPLVVASLELLISVGALVVWASRTSQPTRPASTDAAPSNRPSPSS